MLILFRFAFCVAFFEVGNDFGIKFFIYLKLLQIDYEADYDAQQRQQHHGCFHNPDRAARNAVYKLVYLILRFGYGG